MNKYIKNLSFIGIVIICMVPAHVFAYNNLSSLKQPKGFRDVYWESSKGDHPYLFTTSGNVNGIEVYNRECDLLTLGDAKFSEIAYYYYNDKFYQVLITLRSADDYRPLFDVLVETYGKPEKDSDIFIWENETVSIRLFPGGASISYLPVLNNKQESYY